ncbi:MAG: hypothetical protein DRP18_00515 [Candidatus Aenigmatarchaeota archaeon]|nr:MAG: hypothetical protein DRP18_00515 [Candidatus Aenigmarchaeota archaeon]RLJ08126.1 MAG: hypothetical protein DRP16_02080 [Candidatus Aenigmarchaeota archaeon]
MQKINQALDKNKELIEKGYDDELAPEESAKLLAGLLFDITEATGQKLVYVQNFDEIRKEGPRKYAGRIDTMKEEGLIPQDVYESLKKIVPEGKHIGPVYLRVKGLLTHKVPREIFAKQLARKIGREFLQKIGGKYHVCLPNMTGGAFIGDETRRNLESLYEEAIWPATPYARGMRKTISVKRNEENLTDYIEGLMPPLEETSSVINFEELRTTSETTQNTIRILKRFGYSEENDIHLVAACVFDYRHPVGVERLGRENLTQIYVVDGKTFFEQAYKNGYLDGERYEVVREWLSDPWNWTRKVIKTISE